ncbi:MAG: uroporphyrinogen-III synthase [Thaumarchaeota archaeon S15]|nr:MAG: uroporphyrinogen-III synthase [Thaumarchaeota archaeon S15]
MSLGGAAVAITRAPADAREFCADVRAMGGVPLALPTIRLVARGGAAAAEFLAALRRDDPDYAVFLSSRAVSSLFGAAREASIAGELREAIMRASVVAIGPRTRKAVEAERIRVAHVPDVHSSVGLGELFTSLRAAGRRAAMPRSAASGDFLRLLLEKIGMSVTETTMYDVEPDGAGGDWAEYGRLAAGARPPAVIFTSASSARAFAAIAGPPPGPRVAIGPFTSLELDRAGIGHSTAAEHTVAGALEAAAASLRSGAPPPGTPAPP